MPIEVVQTNESVAVKVKMNGKDVNSIFDSGAGCCVIDIGTLEELGLKHEITPNSNNLVNASGERMDIAGVVKIRLQLPGFKPIIHEFKVLNAKTFSNVLIGRDLMRQFGTITFDFNKNMVQLGQKWLKGVQLKYKEKVRLVGDTSIPARSEQVVNVRCKDYCFLLEADFEPKKLSNIPGVIFSKARVIPNVNGVFQVTALNINESDISLSNRSTVGFLNEAEVLACIDSKEVKRNSKLVEEIEMGKGLTGEQIGQLQNLVLQYSDVFADNPKKPNRTNLMEHRIITENALPVHTKTRRIPAAWSKEVNDQIEEMLKHDIIRPSSSPWNSPLLLVKKKDDSMRFVLDFRGLNDVTKKDNYPLPHIRDVIDKMEDCRFWTTLDAASAYWSMPLCPEDKEKTAFSVPRGKYEFNVTAYGLCNAGASYQRMMDVCLSGLPSDRILAYMDDIVIFSKYFDEHLSAIGLVFSRLRSANISLKASKCVFAAENVDFLGYNLSSNGIKPQKRLTTAIEQFRRPENRKEVRRFLGLAGFYRNFIEGFGDIAHPLNKLTSDNVDFVWDQCCDEAFMKLKKHLTSEPVLAFPRLGDDFIVDVDASDIAFGGVLMQEGPDSTLHPVGYFSDAVQNSQKNWSATTKEAFAMVLAVRHWHVYLAGRKFTLNSDHNPLVHMRQQKDPRGKFSRWITELEEYEYEVKYVPGVKNVKADPLSRNKDASRSQPESFLEEKIYAVVSNDSFLKQIKFEQDEDPVIKGVKRCIAENKEISQGRLKRVQKQLRIESDGILRKSGRIVVPASSRAYILNEVHDPSHFGVDKTYDLLKNRFYWPNMYKFTQVFVEACETCQRSKCLPNPPKAPLLPMFIPSKPMEFIALDIAYMPIDNDGYQYFLLIGDIFSKYINAVPLRDKLAKSVVKALNNSWNYVHGTPQFLLSDQESTVDGEVIRELCNSTGIEKRRSSAYHSQGNGFAERNIRNVKEILRSILLNRKLDQKKWRQLLPELVFALNCSISSAIDCVPYSVVFGRTPTLQMDVVFGTNRKSQCDDVISAQQYSAEIEFSLNDVFHHVIEKLKISKIRMQKQYNRNIRYNDYENGQKVWLKVKYYKTGENRKLSPRRNGPWSVIDKLPNGVNFKIRNDQSHEEKIVHHDRIYPVKGPISVPQTTQNNMPGRKSRVTTQIAGDGSDSSSSGSSEHSDYEPSSEDESDSENSDSVESEEDNHRYPQRVRQQRSIPGAIPWSAVRI